jgi:hypothetical protein
MRLSASLSAAPDGPAPVSTPQQIARSEGVVGLQHFTTERNLIEMLNDGWMRPRKDHGRSQLGGAGDVSYFTAIGALAVKPDADDWVRLERGNYRKGLPDGTFVYRGAPDPTSVMTVWDPSLFDRADWFWNPGLDSGHPQRTAVLPGDPLGLRRRCRDAATRSGNWCAELCFRERIATTGCVRIFAQDEAQRRRIIAAVASAPPPGFGTWAERIRVADPFFDRVVLTDADVRAARAEARCNR